MAGKEIQNDFTVDIQEESRLVLNMLADEHKDALLLHFIGLEARKKQDEVRKNYKDITRFMPGSFATKLYERVIKKVMTFNNAPVQTEERVAVAAKSTKKAKSSK